jgi:hypothetical protein
MLLSNHCAHGELFELLLAPSCGFASESAAGNAWPVISCTDRYAINILKIDAIEAKLVIELSCINFLTFGVEFRTTY